MPVHANARDTIPIRPTTNQVLCPQNALRHFSVAQNSVVFSGRERVQSAVIIVCPLIGLARYRQAWLLAIASAFSMNFSAEAITALAPD